MWRLSGCMVVCMAGEAAKAKVVSCVVYCSKRGNRSSSTRMRSWAIGTAIKLCGQRAPWVKVCGLKGDCRLRRSLFVLSLSKKEHLASDLTVLIAL